MRATDDDAHRDAPEGADIRAAPWGEGRVDRLRPPERDLYHWILRRFAEEGRPDPAAVHGAAARLGLDGGDALASLAREDLVQHDPAGGEIVAAYPFSGRPTAHEVLLDHERRVYAMCAIDALGIPFMLGTSAEVVSRDPVSGEEVWVRVDPGDGLWWEPERAVVLSGSSGGVGTVASRCCVFVNFFRSAENAERYLDDHACLRGEVLSIPEAVEAGRLAFGSLLAGA